MMEALTPMMFDALRKIDQGHITPKDIGVNGTTLNALCARGYLKSERKASQVFYEPTAMGWGAISVLNAPVVPRPYDGPISRIQRTVAEYYNIPMIEMVSQRRSREVARPRQIAMYLARELTTFSLPEIGRRFGNRDHTTVIYAIRKIGEMDEEDPKTSADIAALLDQLEDMRG